MTATRDNPPVTVIVPCLNEEAGLPALLARLRRMRLETRADDWHFLFVDDGSSDGTFTELLRAARDESWIEVVRHPENLGLGAALRTGFDHARSPILCTIDSDCTYPPERLLELTGLIERGAEIVTASAWHPESDEAQGSGFRLLLSRTVSKVYKLLIGQDVYTFTCLFRAYRRDVVRGMRFRADGFAAVAEIMLRAILAGRRIAEVPIPLERRRYGESKLRISDAVMAHMGLLTLTALTVSTRHVRQVLNRWAS
ncbi:MAG TPA: glycosyltransferase family 2 protein [Candidatus Acidoferrales bacterium]|nr:glycosyltransferase family 2 protein [Candidatus Acidoferrales bacterium]